MGISIKQDIDRMELLLRPEKCGDKIWSTADVLSSKLLQEGSYVVVALGKPS